MSLSRKIADALDDLGVGPGIALASDGPNRETLDVVLTSPIAVECQGLEFVTTVRDTWSADELKAWGDRITARVTYLMEQLVIVEVDPQKAAVDIRSKTPTPRGDQKGYYRITLDRTGTLRMHRMAYATADRRSSIVPFQLTREVLERLTDDLVATV